MFDRPNVLFVTTDQHRGDCLGADPYCPTDANGRPLLHTPNVDSFVGQGALFTSAYTPVPSCIPARRCLMTGQTPYTNDCTGWKADEPWQFEHSLPGELAAAGYQTLLAGKLHSIPNRNHLGFERMAQHEALNGVPDDYAAWLDRQGEGFDELAHGLGRNSWDPRPWHLPERYHPTNWTTDRALEFIDERDPTRPFFLNVSYVRPHTPFDPPQAYWDMYVDRDLPDPAMGDWVDDLYAEKLPDYPELDAWLADLPPTVVHRARAGYYGLITHIDHQLKRIVDRLRVAGEWENTVVLFCSDHGEMLGDHYHWRKTYPFEGSARIPFVLRFPDGWRTDLPRQRHVDAPIGLEDVMPTLLDAVGVEVPETVEGRSVLPLVADADSDHAGSEVEDWRAFYHGENTPGSYHPDNAHQYAVDGRWKYVYFPVTGADLLFDLDTDPLETTDLSDDSAHAAEYERCRSWLTDRLADRPEGFVVDGELTTVDADSLTPDGVSLEAE